jgi:NAD(P)-dependent dehydrogenase (short-subunit alcohol dehydrogenase family)
MAHISHTVLITGCSSGFGELMAKTLATAGHHVFASMRATTTTNARAADALRAWATHAGVTLVVLDMDVLDGSSIATGVQAALSATGRIDVLVNNAGRGAIGPFEAFSLEQIEALFSLNVFGPIRVVKAVLPAMRERRSGLIVNVTSTIGRVLPGAGGLYPTTKWALEGFAESLRYEVQPFGIEAVILEPGAFPSKALSKAMWPVDAAVAAVYANTARIETPTGQTVPDGYRAPDLQEVADALARLVAMPYGSRPLRTVVGPIFTEGVAEYNDAYERASKRLAEALRRPDQAITWGPGAADAR